MTIEQNLTSIAESLKIIADVLSNKQARPEAAPVVPNVQPASVAATVSQMETTAASTSSVATPSLAPIATPASDFNLTTFVLDAYKKLGPIKGAGIQAVLQQVGTKNINDVKPEQYAAVKAGVEALLTA